MGRVAGRNAVTRFDSGPSCVTHVLLRCCCVMRSSRRDTPTHGVSSSSAGLIPPPHTQHIDPECSLGDKHPIIPNNPLPNTKLRHNKHEKKKKKKKISLSLSSLLSNSISLAIQQQQLL